MWQEKKIFLHDPFSWIPMQLCSGSSSIVFKEPNDVSCHNTSLKSSQDTTLNFATLVSKMKNTFSTYLYKY